jgi:outer membrane protein assembly factor BamB
MKGTYALFLGALATGLTLPCLAAAEGCLGPTPVAGRVMALDPRTGRANEVYQVPGASLARPAVAADVLYVGRPYQLDAVKLQGGKVLWSFPADYIVYDIRPTPQTVFCGAGATLHAVKPATGKEIWKFQSKGAVDGLLLADGMVLFGSHQGVRAVDQQTGRQRWLLPGPRGWDELSLGGGGTICSWGRENTLVADLKNGKRLWQEKSVGDPEKWAGFPVNVVASDGRLFSVPVVDEDKGKITVTAADVVTRRPIWKTTLEARLGKHLALYALGGQVLVANENGDNAVFALEAATGKVRWQLPAGKPAVSVLRGTADRTTIFVTDGQSTLWALDRQTGKTRWHYAPPQPPANQYYSILAPTATPDAIYVTVNQLKRSGGGDR